MSALNVLNVTPGTGRWTLGTGTYHANNVLTSGIQFGVTPPHAVVGMLEPLISGVMYSVEVYRWIDSAGTGTLAFRGSLAFRP